jgi:hypothetical protein
MTECNQSSFEFKACGKREIVARFDGGTISSDGGALLLRQTDQRLNLLPRLAECFLDGRNQEQVEHSILEMLAQRIYGLALGYEDINDHEQLRTDPVFGILAGRNELEEPLAGKSTLNRMELGTGAKDRYKKITFWKEAIDELLVKVFLEWHEKAPDQIIVDVDTTDLPLHGKQEGRFFHGYYDSYCYLPLYIVLRRAYSVRAVAGSQPRRLVRLPAGSAKDCGADSGGMAGSKNHPARRFRLLPQRADELVRKPGRGLCVRASAQSEAAEDHRRSDASSHSAVE